ncbi:hypothetical protein CHS0354_013619 [Potamilus streckersoni]|uniref:Uncharacterized protein n=1 Tax=Potamilus streckersoni TaxID=2493646 RepID=A0AAE0SKG4_9BIVA|nr:hypothetical protein CHS0354_013619 [Potamilus streckersoni]
MTELRVLDMMGVTLSSRCCDILGSTVTHCTKIMKFIIHKIDLHSCKLDLPKITELIDLDISEVTLSSNSCDALGSTLTHCTKLNMLSVHATDLHNCLLDLSNMTELIDLNISDVRLSSSCCDVLGKTLTHCTKLERLRIQKTDLSICLLDLSNMSELTKLDIAKATLSSNCCDVLCRTMTHCTKCNSLKIYYTDIHNGVFDFSNMIDLHLDFIGVIMSCNALQSFCSINRAYLWNLTLEKSQCDNDRWKVNLFDPDTFSDQEIYFNDSDRESFHDLYQ